MGFLSSLFGRSPVVDQALTGPRFAVDSESIPPEVFGLASYESPTAPAPRIDRRSAIQVPAVKRSRDLIAGSIGGLPLQTFRGAGLQEMTTSLLEQPERDVPRSVTMTRTAEDMLFEQFAWWRVVERNAAGWPLYIRRLNPRSVDTSRGDQKVWVRRDGTIQGESWEWVPDQDLIRFDSPNDGLLTAGARAIRTCLRLDAAAARSAESPMPQGIFTPAEGADPVGVPVDDETQDEADVRAVREMLAAYQAARQLNADAYIPASLKYNPLSWDPEKLQLNEARQHAVLEIARVAGVDPEELGVSTTSRTYSNQFDRRKAFLDFTLGGYLRAIEDRLSMGDVTPRGQYVKFNLDAFLRSDALTRYQAYQAGLAAGALTPDEVRQLEDRPPLTEDQMPKQLPSNVRQLPSASNFAADDNLLTMTTEVDQQFSVDLEARTISGLAVPYGAQAFHAGMRYEFSKGSIGLPADVSRVKLFVNHDSNRAVGYATQLVDTDQGLHATFKVVNSPAGDEALLMADGKVWDGLSAGFKQGSKFRTQDGVQFAVDAPVGEISICPSPAFDDARVSAVALTADKEGITMTDTTVTPAATAPEISVTDQVAAELAKFGIKPGETLNFNEVTKAIEDGFASLQAAAGGPTVIPAVPGGTGAAQFQVNEELPYRFDGSTKGEHCFTDDLRDMQHGNQEAKKRLETFMEESTAQFAVTKANSAAFNPTQNRPELYVPQLGHQRPIWESVSTGVIDNITAFTVPKFSSFDDTKVGAHTEGLEPTPGSFAATVQTVTPTAISGKVEINREVWDQGGNPQTDTIVWGEMQRAYFEGIEVNLATMLNGLTASTLYTGAEINLGDVDDAALDAALKNVFVGLQFVRGGNRYTSFVADGTLYGAIVAAKDSAGRSLYPLLGPTNANGTVAPVLSSANVLGQTVKPAWALGNAADGNSYLFVPQSVWAWASAPKRFTFEYQVKSVDMAVWGYTASAVLRNSDVARIDYTDDTP